MDEEDHEMSEPLAPPSLNLVFQHFLFLSKERPSSSEANKVLDYYLDECLSTHWKAEDFSPESVPGQQATVELVRNWMKEISTELQALQHNNGTYQDFLNFLCNGHCWKVLALLDRTSKSEETKAWWSIESVSLLLQLAKVKSRMSRNFSNLIFFCRSLWK